MADVEETSNANIIFRGTDGNDCEAFVVAIRDIAFAKGKDEDYNWMLRYATTRLRGKALRWHAKLDLSVQQSWHLFVQALFEEYPSVEERDGGGIVTPVWTATTFSPAPSTVALSGSDSHPITASTSRFRGTEVVLPGTTQPSSLLLGGELVPPPRVYDSSLPGFQMGRLLVLYEEGRTSPHYVTSSGGVTSNAHQAAVVTFILASGPHEIVYFPSDGKALGVRLKAPDYSEFHSLLPSRKAAVPNRIRSGDWEDVSGVWNILNDGTLNATLPDFVLDTRDTNKWVPSDRYSTTTVCVDISGQSISFVKNYSTPRATHPDSGLPIVRARIVFQPL